MTTGIARTKPSVAAGSCAHAFVEELGNMSHERAFMNVRSRTRANLRGTGSTAMFCHRACVGRVGRLGVVAVSGTDNATPWQDLARLGFYSRQVCSLMCVNARIAGWHCLALPPFEKINVGLESRLCAESTRWCG